ncbi:MAG: carbonic anhydrase [Firmicutes bacterium]|nr:carbonic anhydrase [Bacillota bacterium]
MAVEEEDLLARLLRHNAAFRARAEASPPAGDGRPRRALLILTCMDARLTCLVPAALGLEDGDAHVVRTPGALIPGPQDGALQAIVVSVARYGTRDILVLGHTDCAMEAIDGPQVRRQLQAQGVDPSRLADWEQGAGLGLEAWLRAAGEPEAAVRATCRQLRAHPLIPSEVRIHGGVLDTGSGAVRLVVDGRGPGPG